MGYGAQIQVLRKACAKAKEELDVSCELIDLRTLLPWDVDTVAEVSRYYGGVEPLVMLKSHYYDITVLDSDVVLLM